LLLVQEIKERFGAVSKPFRIEVNEIAFIGDDVNDLQAIQSAG
jgi:3-deoxy-D-manno-octulosonate 8-phosphate phosphatase KdsC-like HAD superfamily phosphatase